MIKVQEINGNVFSVELTDDDATGFIQTNKLTDVIPGKVIEVSIIIAFESVNNN